MALWTEAGTCLCVTREGPYPEASPRAGQAIMGVKLLKCCVLVGFFVVFYVLSHRKLSGLQCVPSIRVPRRACIKHPTESHSKHEIPSDRR